MILFIKGLNKINLFFIIKPKRCIKRKADMLKNPSKATRFNYDTHDCTFHVQCILQQGWLAISEGYKVLLAGLFHHICLPKVKQFLQLVGSSSV